MIIYLNGQMMNAQKAVVSVYDHGFLYGLGFFETFRTYNGKAFLIERHLERLRAACHYVGIEQRLTTPELNQVIAELLQLNKLNDAYVRVTISAGNGELGLPTENYKEPTVLILVKPLAQVSEASWIAGKALQLLATRRNTPEGPIRFKSLHFMNNIIAKRELQMMEEKKVAGAEGLMLTRDDKLAEGIVSNLFFVQGERLYTPHIDTGILPGITRQYVIEIAKQLGYRVQEGFYDWEMLWEASEIWITNSVQELVPITALLGLQGEYKIISNGKAGPICAQLADVYRAATV